MTIYRDLVGKHFPDDPHANSVLGCGLDRVGGPITENEYQSAYGYYKTNIAHWLETKMPLSGRRQLVADHVLALRPEPVVIPPTFEVEPSNPHWFVKITQALRNIFNG